MISQQLARYVSPFPCISIIAVPYSNARTQLLKSARSVLANNTPINDTTRVLAHFLSRRDIGCAFDIISSDTDVVSAFAWRSAFLTFEALKHRDEQKKPWNDLLVDFYRLSKAHSQYMVVKNFQDALVAMQKSNEIDTETQDILRKLYRLYALHTLEQEGSEFYASGACSRNQISLTRTNTVMKLLKEIRPHAVRLVDVRTPKHKPFVFTIRYSGGSLREEHPVPPFCTFSFALPIPFIVFPFRTLTTLLTLHRTI
jgi:hypothetical protein